MPVQFNASSFPLVTMVFTAPVLDQDITQASLQILGLLAKKTPFTLVSDMSQAAPSPAQGKLLSSLMDQRRDEFRTYLRGNCLVVGNLLVRAALRASLLASKPPFPVSIEASTLLAQLWCEAQLKPTKVAASR